jgi:hypothetical protein
MFTQDKSILYVALKNDIAVVSVIRLSVFSREIELPVRLLLN